MHTNNKNINKDNIENISPPIEPPTKNQHHIKKAMEWRNSKSRRNINLTNPDKNQDTKDSFLVKGRAGRRLRPARI